MNRNQVVLTFITIITLVLSAYLFWEGLKPTFIKTPQSSTARQNIAGEATGEAVQIQSFKVNRVVDGDTIEVDYMGVPKILRMIGINTPETVDPRRPVQCFGKEASSETKRLLEGKSVVLEKDVSETDKYGRLLRYIYLNLNDGTQLFVNDYLVREGFAQADTFPPDVKFKDRFVSAQKEARENNRGLWSKCQ